MVVVLLLRDIFEGTWSSITFTRWSLKVSQFSVTGLLALLELHGESIMIQTGMLTMLAFTLNRFDISS